MPDATPCPWYLIGRDARLEYDKDISGIGNSDRTSAAARPAHDSLPLARMCRRGDGLYSHLRLVTAAALVAFAGVIAVGVPALLPAAVERPPVVGGLPWMAERRGLAALELPVARANTPQQPGTENAPNPPPQQPPHPN